VRGERLRSVRLGARDSGAGRAWRTGRADGRAAGGGLTEQLRDGGAESHGSAKSLPGPTGLTWPWAAGSDDCIGYPTHSQGWPNELSLIDSLSAAIS
jgi:hypothetical protein